MPRDAKYALGRDPTTPPPIAQTIRPTPSSIPKPPVMLVDPYSQRMFAYTKRDDAMMIQHTRPAPDATGGASKLQRVLQLALLSSVAVMIWFMLSILQTTG